MKRRVQKPKATKMTLSKALCIPAPEAVWKPSTVGAADLENLVLNGMLQPREEVLWNSCYGQLFPSEGAEEVVLFRSFCERGLILPASSFFRELLDFYGLEVHHLTPNNVSPIASFVHFFEAFLGLDPSLSFFRFIFHIKSQPSAQNIRVVGGAGIQLRQGSGVQWFLTPIKNKHDKWDSEWFTIGKNLYASSCSELCPSSSCNINLHSFSAGNHAPKLTPKSGYAPKPTDGWKEQPSRYEHPEFELLGEDS
jgi:hypothetical protein